MFKINRSEAPMRERNGLVSYILLQKDVVGDTGLAITWVDVEPGAEQLPHTHRPEQVYVITKGRGRMTVGDEIIDVWEGDMVHIPADTLHGVENTGSGVLTYISASTPAFRISDLYDGGPLK